uniref:Uncharacterized protein n=1 Tax=Rattus norvegicus TaxID=10116 RepID=A0A8I6GMG6_RAT
MLDPEDRLCLEQSHEQTVCFVRDDNANGVSETPSSHRISRILDARLDMETVYVLCWEQGMDPAALSLVIQESHVAARTMKAET